MIARKRPGNLVDPAAQFGEDPPGVSFVRAAALQKIHQFYFVALLG